MANEFVRILLVVTSCSLACATSADTQSAADPDPPIDQPHAVEDEAEAELFARNPCPDGADFYAACLQDDIGQCCHVAGIKYEYEMLESRKLGDEASEKRHRETLLELLSHGCDLEAEVACRELEVLTAKLEAQDPATKR